MTPSNVLSQLFRSTSYKMPDPGNGKTITVDRQFGVMSLTSTGIETRTLAAPTKAGIAFSVMMIVDGGDISFTVTGTYDGTNTVITFDQVEDWVVFYSIETSPGVFQWRAGAAGGTALGMVQTISNLATTSLDLGRSGEAGSLDIFPATASRGKLNVAVTDQTGDTTVSVLVDAMAAARTIHLPDPGKTSYLMQSTAQITCAEADVLDNVTAGTLAASKAIVTDANSHVNALKTTALHLGPSGSATQVTATAAQLNTLAGASAGIAAVLAGGLGGSASFAKTSAATTTLIAAHATKDRAVLVVVVVDETYAIGTGTLPTVKIGEDDTIEKCMAATVLDTEAAGTVYVFAFTNTATKKIVVTTTAAVGNSTGGCTITAIAIPTT